MSQVNNRVRTLEFGFETRHGPNQPLQADGGQREGGSCSFNSDRQVEERQKSIPNRILTAFPCFAFLVSVFACATCGSGAGAACEMGAPSVEILEGNYEHAAYVLEIEVKDVHRVATFRSDSGKVGYVQYSVAGNILDVHKSSEELESFSDEVEYRFTQEYDPEGKSAIAKGEKYLVFLMLTDDPPRFWLIGNGAQFELGPELSKTIRQIAEQE